MTNRKRLVREQLQRSLQRFEPLRKVSPPVKGWVRAVRDALGMNGRQFADRLGGHRSRTSQIEQDELAGAVTIRTMRRAAEALDCVFVYGLVPRTSLEQTVRDRAEQVAAKRLAQVNQTMLLEAQALDPAESNRAQVEMVRELVDAAPSTLWDEQ